MENISFPLILAAQEETLEKVWKYWHSLWRMQKNITMDNKTEFLGMYEFHCISQQIVGSGVFALTGIVIGLTGHSACHGFVLAALIAVCQLVSMATLASVCRQPAAATCM